MAAPTSVLPSWVTSASISFHWSPSHSPPPQGATTFAGFSPHRPHVVWSRETLIFDPGPPPVSIGYPRPVGVLPSHERAHTPAPSGFPPLQALPPLGHQGSYRFRLDSPPTGLPSGPPPNRAGPSTLGQHPAGPAVVAPIGQSDSVGASPHKPRRSARLAARYSGSPLVPYGVLLPSSPPASSRPGLVALHGQDQAVAPLAVIGSPTLRPAPLGPWTDCFWTSSVSWPCTGTAWPFSTRALRGSGGDHPEL